ncbi:TetR/AcrR family transcriptional regulator [Streptomyces sp. NBC_00237]|uniref:TetR/AcrR family transcriptional regulator n=1 Tax=Streptomyces sp. NBC_00237 TaxID=2975687 RepID=UPI002252BB79|nr:TetR/AcrR family transcriptional regulator [Streptomyces sp. NBC_00237]MCX5205453.1 TetR/AcrR family transcriptional regulator [Streptomyces sp. NBC_00237]
MEQGRTGAEAVRPQPAARHHGNRHGRSEQARQAVLEAADDLLVEKGFSGVTIEGIAARAGVAKQTVYRWWKTKTDILLDAFLQDAAEALTPPDHGDLAQDLRAHLRQLALFLTRSDAGAVFKALIGHAQHDPAFAAALRSGYLDEQRRRDRLPLERAVERGQLALGLDPAAEIDQLVGPVYHRVLVTAEPVDQAFTDRLVEAFLHRADAAGTTDAADAGEMGSR